MIIDVLRIGRFLVGIEFATVALSEDSRPQDTTTPYYDDLAPLSRPGRPTILDGGHLTRRYRTARQSFFCSPGRQRVDGVNQPESDQETIDTE